MLLILLTLIATLGTVAGGLGSFFYWREVHSDSRKQKSENLVQHALHPYDLRLSALEMSSAHSADAIEAAVTRALQPVSKSVTSMETQVSYLWELQKQAAFDAASVLHHPEQGRRMIDELLDAFVEDTLTSEEEVQLRKYLVIIKNWEPGEDVGFPVYQGEQIAAAGLLRFLNFTRTSRTRSTPEETRPSVESQKQG